MSPSNPPAGNGSTNPAPNSRRSNGPNLLTPRELEVAHWIGRGKGDEEIARILERSTTTVKKHVQHILKKLGLETRLDVCRWCHEEGRKLVRWVDKEPV